MAVACCDARLLLRKAAARARIASQLSGCAMRRGGGGRPPPPPRAMASGRAVPIGVAAAQ
eukprot:SAG25_NODE_125_length_14598_cov_7.819611_5_plen_60_part_00